MQGEAPPNLQTALFTSAAHHIASAVVGRDCRFAGLAICVITIAQMHAPARALVTGGMLAVLVGMVLVALAWRTPRWKLRRSEIWRSIHQDLKLSPDEAVPLLRSVLRATYLRFAGLAAWAGAWFLAMAGLYASYAAWATG